jgi:5'-nucleotidase
MNRKTFLKMLSGGTLAAAFVPNILFAENYKTATKNSIKKLTILHTNDQHSRIEPFDSSYTKNPNQGGFARRASLIQSIRNKESNVLLVDSGDTFQGTPYFNFFGGEIEFRLMTMMGYEASTLGNHDFDNGLEGFLKVQPNAKFPFICSNYEFKNTLLENSTIPYKILDKNGIKVGLFGLGVELEGLVGKKNYGETKYLDPIEISNHYADFLKNKKKCDLVICLSHIGYDYESEPDKICDKKLVAQTENIDLILGGHTHTFFKEPEVFKNKNDKNVLVNQVGWAGLLLGRLDYFFDENNKIQNIAWNNQVIDETILV